MKKSIISLILLLSFSTAAVAATSADLQPTAPDRYVVVPGDTLWSIATRFLKDPWRWPELWKMNQSQLRNPHRIYPGDTLVLDRSRPGDVTMHVDATTRISPRVRIEAREADAIQTIPPSVIEPFLSKPLVVTATELDRAPRIVATEEDRVALGAGGTAYADRLAPGDDRWQIFRRGDPLIDPESGQTLGYVAIYAGEAELVRPGEISTIRITKANQEVLRGDKLIPLNKEVPVFAYVPHAPQARITGRVISTYGGLWETGPLSIVALSKGTRDGLEVGHVLALYHDQSSSRYDQRTQPLWGRTGPTGNDKRIPYYSAGSDRSPRETGLFESSTLVRPSDLAKLPAERYGLVMVFRSFERASFALVMNAGRPVPVADIISNP
jgi:hypothetical protein